MKDTPQKLPKKFSKQPLMIPAFPEKLLIGDFTLTVKQITTPGTWNSTLSEFQGVSGTAWLLLNCGTFPGWVIDPNVAAGVPLITYTLEVVPTVVEAQTQISFTDAQHIQPSVKMGESLTLSLDLKPNEFQEVVQAGKGIWGWLETAKPKGGILVEFSKVNVHLSNVAGAPGQIVHGSAVYPTQPAIPTVIQRNIAGFRLTISAITLTPEDAMGVVSVQLPGGIASPESCLPVSLDLGEIHLTPNCNFYVDAHDQAFGPWLLGDTGLQIEGMGFVLDLSTTQSPVGWSPGWRGLVLFEGAATGEGWVHDPCNTGYLRGLYGFNKAIVVHDGFYGKLTLLKPIAFEALNPCGTIVDIHAGYMLVSQSRVVGGEFGPGEIQLPLQAVCRNGPGDQVVAKFNKLSLQADLDLAGQVAYTSGPLSWGEFTHPGAEMVTWMAAVADGLCYLPAGPLASLCPDSGGSFIQPSISYDANTSLTELAAYGITGVTFRLDGELMLMSPDRPGGTGNPLTLQQVMGWLRAGCRGVDGELYTYHQSEKESLGEPNRPGYVGGIPFEAVLFNNDQRNLLAQFITSAVYDSSLSGAFAIPIPCLITELGFEHMQVTSTGHLVGGDVVLPTAGVPLDFWKLQLVPTGNPSKAGVVSVRTGRIIFTAAGIQEDIHFSEPFPLTWGEMLADGNLGQLFFDYNNYGQRFDGIPFNPHQVMLSKYIPETFDAYLATCGSIHFNFFGLGYVNIRDARNTNPLAPFWGRLVTVPKNAEIKGCQPTNLNLKGTWKNIKSEELAAIDCKDEDVDYNHAHQEGFIGTGKGVMSFLHSDGLDALVEIHPEAIDIRLSSETTHDLDLSLHARMGGMKQIVGCARIEGPLLKRMSFYGVLEHSFTTGMSILEPKAGYAVEININTTPNSLDFYASGDMLMSVAGLNVEVSAMLHLLLDYAKDSAEGEIIGRIRCDAILAGLSGEGQLTWYVGPAMQYLQGRMRVYVCSWIVSGGLEGGFFIGHKVPKNLAWVLKPTNPHFGVSDAILPATLTGLFGYGQISLGVNYYVLGGGVSLYAGMGAFSEIPTGQTSAWSSIAGLPYVIGSCGIHAHGEILGGVVSASAWANLSLRGPVPTYYEGTIGLEGCVAWVICASVKLTAGINSSGFYLY